MKRILFSSVLGCAVFSERYEQQDLIRPKDAKAYLQGLQEGKWTEAEEEALRKYAKDELFLVGWKQEKKQGIKLTQDPKKAEKLREWQQSQEGLREQLYILARQRIRNAIGNDQVIIRAILAYDELGKSANRLSKKLRELYELEAPEVSRAIDKHEQFAKIIAESTTEQSLRELKLKELSGRPLGKSDTKAMKQLAALIRQMYAEREEMEQYLHQAMQQACPNITAVATPVIGAQLLSLAGSLEDLATMPSSAIQLLGAEKALFRFLRDKKQRPPKYGILHEHPLLATLPAAQRGKAARVIADKLSIAAKLDYFHGEYLGDKLKADIAKRFGK